MQNNISCGGGTYESCKKRGGSKCAQHIYPRCLKITNFSKTRKNISFLNGFQTLGLMDITGTFEEFLNNYTVVKNGIEDKIVKFNAGETPTYDGFEEINNALTKAIKTSHELYGDNGANLDSDLDGLVTYLGAEIGCIKAETYLLNESDPIKSTLKRKSSINTASKLDKGTRRNLNVQLKQTSQILSLCDNSLKKTLFLYADTNLARKFYVNKNKFPGLFHKEDSLPIIFHYMYPK